MGGRQAGRRRTGGMEAGRQAGWRQAGGMEAARRASGAPLSRAPSLWKGLSVSSHDNEFRNTAVQGFGGFVGSLAKLLVVGGLLDQIEDAVG